MRLRVEGEQVPDKRFRLRPGSGDPRILGIEGIRRAISMFPALYMCAVGRVVLIDDLDVSIRVCTTLELLAGGGRCADAGDSASQRPTTRRCRTEWKFTTAM